jgi:anti-anti-sigma factor
MSPAASGFEMSQQGDTLIVTPTSNLREVVYDQVEAGAEEVLERLNNPSIRNVVMDFAKTDYFGSTAVGFFVRLWKRVCTGNGRMAFCNVSDHEREILRVTKLHELWPICSTREEALRAVADGPR